MLKFSSRQSVSSIPSARIDTVGSQWRAVITDGPQRGASAPIDAVETRIGGGSDNDLVIHGTAVPDRIGTLIYKGNALGLLAESNDVHVGRRIAIPGRFEPLVPGVIVSCHGAHIVFERPGTRGFRASRYRTVLSVCVATTVMVFAVAFLYPWRAQNWRHDGQADNQPPVPSETMAPQSVIMALKHYLSGAKLGKEITLRADHGTVLAAGIIEAGQKTQWLHAQRWLDRVSNSHAPLLDHVQVLPNHVPPPVALAAVILQPSPMIVTVSGTRYMLGATLPKGWHLDRIGRTNVEFSRQGVTVREHY